ncbi:MAG: O-antigen ligase family protein [Candidatus Falkowbacteria bacterium]
MKYLNKTIEYGLYLLVFLLPIQTRWIIKMGELNGGPWEYGTYGLYATDILLLVLLVLFIIVTARDRRERSSLTDSPRRCEARNGRVIWRFVEGLILISAVSALFATSRLLALYKFGWLILGIGLFWLIVRANYNRVKLIYAILTGVFLQAVLGIWQFLTQSSFANKWLGLALHNGADLGTSVIEAVGADGIGERWLRSYGGLDHPNILGGMLVAGIILIISQIIIYEKSFRATNKIKKTILWLFLVVFTAGLFFSFSRSAWLGLAVGLAVMVILAVVDRNLKLQKGLAEIILVMGVLLFILFNQYQNLITSRLGSEGRLEEKSTSERLVSYQESWQLTKNNWATGVGLGNYTLVLSRQMPGRESFYYQPTHNVFLLVWSEIGIFGLLFFIGLIIYALMGLFRRYAFSDDGRMAILIALIVIMFFDHWLFSLHFGVLFFWLVLGLVMNREEEK